VHPDVQGIINYAYLFAMIFWGWLNGSEYHDLHGSPGIRTRFMTLWQMMAVAALGVALSSPAEVMVQRTTVCFAILQGFITYLWWSVGIYDKVHRKLSVPYVASYLAVFLLLIVSLYVPPPYKPYFFIAILLINYLPPFLNQRVLSRNQADFSLSMSMVERLGLFTIIVFGEDILGVINGLVSVRQTNAGIWLCFGLGILIVFALWWVFFAMVADRECRHGFMSGQILAILYIPALASLGIVGATFSVLFSAPADMRSVMLIFCCSLGMFILSVVGITRMLLYPEDYNKARSLFQPLMIAIAIVFVAIGLFLNSLPLLYLLLTIFVILLVVIILITRIWFVIQLRHIAAGNDTTG
jgi:low temperature requirement protein LtrA